jgi:transposase-like protein
LKNIFWKQRCPQCKKTYTEVHKQPLGGMTTPPDKALLALQLLFEGNSIRSTQRIAGIDQNTIMKLLVVAGEKCEKLMDV